MDGTRSRASLLNFLDYLLEKGLLNQSTARSRKAAVNKVLGVLDAREAEDVSSVDIDALMKRFSNLHGSKYTPDSLATYKSRIKAALEDFLSYVDDPMSFRPATQGSAGRQERSRKAGNGRKTVRDDVGTGTTARFVEAPPASVHVLPIPIRPDLIVRIQGLPYDLTKGEATKISNVILAMAGEE